MTVSSPDRPAAPPRDPLEALRALRAERTLVAHWRRLVRARMDLAVAALVPTAPLGYVAGAPDHLTLLDAVSAGGPPGELDRLEHLRDLDLRLAAYADSLTHRIETAARTVAAVPRTSTTVGADLDVPGHP